MRKKSSFLTANAALMAVCGLILFVQLVGCRSSEPSVLKRVPTGVQVEEISKLIDSFQKEYGWIKERIPLVEAVSLEDVAGAEATPESSKKIYEFNIRGKYLSVFVFHDESDMVHGTHVAFFGSYAESANELFLQLRQRVPTSFKSGSAMESWIGEQGGAVQPATAQESKPDAKGESKLKSEARSR